MEGLHKQITVINGLEGAHQNLGVALERSVFFSTKRANSNITKLLTRTS